MNPTLRASSVDRAFSCHGSLTLEAKVRENTIDLGEGDGGHAVQWAGSWCHYEAARRFIEEFGAVGINEKPNLPATFKPTGYDQWVVEWYIHRVLELTPRDWGLFVERALSHTFKRWTLPGHIDVYALSPCQTIAVINDLKRGFGDVDEAENNWQLCCYGALLKSEIPTLQKVILRIHQPAAPDRTTEAVVTNLDALLEIVDREANAAFDDPFTLNTGKHCNYCEALLDCPAIRWELTMEYKLTKEEVDRLTGVAPIQDLAKTVAAGRRLSHPIKRLTEALKTRLMQTPGVPVTMEDGSTVEANKVPGDRTITDSDFTYRRLTEKVGPLHAIAAFKPSLTKIEEVLYTKGDLPKTSKNADKETCVTWVRDNLGSVIARPETVELTWK